MQTIPELPNSEGQPSLKLRATSSGLHDITYALMHASLCMLNRVTRAYAAQVALEFGAARDRNCRALVAAFAQEALRWFSGDRARDLNEKSVEDVGTKV